MKEKYIEDLQEIREIMNRSSRFISLSGLSGVAAGCSALIGAVFAYYTIYQDHNLLQYERIDLNTGETLHLILVATGTLLLAIAFGVYFTTRETKKKGLKTWDRQSQRLLVRLGVPLAIGGFCCLILHLKGYTGLVLPLMLIFYGLALENASAFTLKEVRSLGIIEMLIGLCAMLWIEQSLVFWILGFGILHIVYGLVIHRKYSR